MTRVEQFLSSINFFKECQSVFKKDRVTQGTIFDLMSSLQSALDNNKKCATIFIDLKKPFHTVDHSILLYKLNKIGFNGQAVVQNKEVYRNNGFHFPNSITGHDWFPRFGNTSSFPK